MNMNAIRKDPYAINHYTVRFEAGLLLLWPSYVLYYVHPHLYHAPALRIRVDVRVTPSDGGRDS